MAEGRRHSLYPKRNENDTPEKMKKKIEYAKEKTLLGPTRNSRMGFADIKESAIPICCSCRDHRHLDQRFSLAARKLLRAESFGAYKHREASEKRARKNDK